MPRVKDEDKAFRLKGRVVGTWRRFAYPEYFVTLPDYTKHAGQVVRVLRQTLESDRSLVMERMFTIRAKDGWTGDAFESELTRKVPGNKRRRGD